MRGIHFVKWSTIFFMILLQIPPFHSVSSTCEFSFVNNGKMYNFNLASPISKFAHGVLSEDGYCSSSPASGPIFKSQMYEKISVFSSCVA